MKLRFKIQYTTKWGESLWVEVTTCTIDGVRKTYSQQMNTDDGEWWAVEVAVMESRQRVFTSFEYEYQLRNSDNGIIRREWNMVKRSLPCENAHDYVMNDSWKDVPLMSHLYSLACITTSGRLETGGSQSPQRLPLYRKTIMFRISAPQINKGQSIAICGNHPALGGWSVSRYMKMMYVGHTVWTLTMNVDNLYSNIEYKYIVVDDNSHELLQWEGGENRIVDVKEMRDGEVVVLDDRTLRIAEETWKAAGVAVPVFSLRSNHSCGVGDFGDLGRMVDWVSETGMKILQILPVNDTTMQHNWQDSFPYNIISVNALHPQYIDLEQVGPLDDDRLMTEYNRRRTELNSLDYSDYEGVERVKSEYMHRIFDCRKESLANDADFCKFVVDNSDWLIPYTAFCILRDANHTARFTDWGENAVYDRKKAKAINETEEAEYIHYVQYLLHKQLQAAADYARRKGVVLMGDMPIGVSKDSAEAWANPSLFNLDSQAGTMPDYLNRHGQNWGFPTFNWDAIEDDKYRWWHERLRNCQRYFSAIRIDHVLGYFRIWEIPNESIDGLCGHFSPSIPLNEDEMAYYGFTFHKDIYTRPIITDKIIERTFGIHANYVREQYLNKKAYDMYDLKPEVDTQKKIHEQFAGRNDESSIWIRDGLCRLASNVLFVHDKNDASMYHPRVNAYKSSAYQMLSGEERDAFMRLYNNYYYERHNSLWEYKGNLHLSMIFNGCDMLTCAEDLGQSLNCVGNVLEQLRIPSLEVQRMPKQGESDFAHLEANPYLSLTTISTHDMSPLRLWWQENQQRTQHYYADMLQKEGRAPEQLTTVLAEEIIARHLYSPSMMCVLTIQDWLSMDGELRSNNPRSERINTPGDSFNQWKYRMNVTIEKLMADTRFNAKIMTMIKRSKR